jgi:hypothetical protein
MTLDEMTEPLWPGGTRRGGSGERYAVLPSRGRPRLLVPMGAARAAAAVVRYSIEPAGRRSAVRRRLLAIGFRFGVAGLTFRDRITVAEPRRGLACHLSEILGTPIVLGVQLGPERANRKPVAPVLTRRGTLIGFAKLGVNPLTDRLVEAETAALRALLSSPPPGVLVPGVVHSGSWNGHPLLVQSALPVWRPRLSSSRSGRPVQDALLAVARTGGVTEAAYVGSAFSRGLVQAVSDCGDRPEAHRLQDVIERVSARSPVLSFGSWHGDWNGTNHAVLADGQVLVWDWERFERGVPLGFDALHMRLQTAVTGARTDPAIAVRDLLTTARTTLRPFGLRAAHEAEVVAVLYLCALGARYLTDRQAEAGSRLGRPAEWLLPPLEERLAPRAAHR